MKMMKLFVGRRPVSGEDAYRKVSKARVPFVVKTADGKGFKTLPRVFLATDAGARVECENDAELRFACRILEEEARIAGEDSNTIECIRETDAMEKAAAEFMSDPAESEEEVVDEQEDISIEEWAQLGYKWFKQEEVHYI